MSPAKRLVLVLAVLTAALIVIAASALFVGSAAISPRAVLNALAGRAAPESVERVVTLSIRGNATGASSSGQFRVVDEFGVYWSWLGTSWPADTYTFTATSGGPTVTGTLTKPP